MGEGERKGEKHPWVRENINWLLRETSIGCLSRAPKRDLAHNPDWESNQFQAGAQPTETHQPEPNFQLLVVFRVKDKI